MTVDGLPAGVRRGVSLAPLTTLGVGGAAEFYAEAFSVAVLRELLEWARSRAMPVFVLGGGSNVVIDDAGFDGLVVRMTNRGIESASRAGRVELRVNAGEPWDGLVAHCVEQGLAGLECLSGIPGLTGAAPIQNIGAYGQEVAERIEFVEAVSRLTGASATFSSAECEFGYRDSRFKRDDKGEWVVTRIGLSLDARGVPNPRYPELTRALENAVAPTLADVRNAVLGLRRSKGMVIDAADPDTRSVGSFFMNPVVDAGTFEDLVRRAEALGIARGSIPAFAAGDRMKLSAAWLIERAGFVRGTRRGDAALSSKHALAIVNAGNASSSSICALADEIRDAVRRTFGIVLVPEAVRVGG